jgi:hypothetical protein
MVACCGCLIGIDSADELKAEEDILVLLCKAADNDALVNRPLGSCWRRISAGRGAGCSTLCASNGLKDDRTPDRNGLLRTRSVIPSRERGSVRRLAEAIESS